MKVLLPAAVDLSQGGETASAAAVIVEMIEIQNSILKAIWSSLDTLNTTVADLAAGKSVSTPATPAPTVDPPVDTAARVLQITPGEPVTKS